MTDTFNGDNDKWHYCYICKEYNKRKHFQREHGISIKKNNELRTYH